MKKLTVILSSFVAVALTIPVAALAVNPSSGTDPSGAGTAAGSQVDGGSLPFTGQNLAVILVAATILIAVGFLLRRRATHQS